MAAAAIALPAAAAPAASADVVWSAPLQFGSLPLGASSGVQSLTMTVTTNGCPATMPGATMAGTSCTIDVRFSPTFVGSQGAAISSGTHLAGAPPAPTPAAVGQAFGYGICSTCFPGYFPGPNGQVTNAAVSGPSVGATKKCKKAKASAAKRCKKKRK